MKKSYILLCLTLSLSIPGFSQSNELKEVFLAAESYFLFEEYNEALPLYLQIHRTYPDNDNINYKIGVCFVNSPYEKDKSIVYLEKAVENINPKYKENSFRETSAPPEALFYLGTAYRVNNQLKKAREYFTKFLEVLNPDVYDSTLVKNQIAACDAAASLMKKPIDFDRKDLPDVINTRFAETNPVVSGDETKMAFISKLQFYDAIFFTEKENGKWKNPRNIVPELGVDGDVYPTSLSYDGTEMFIYRNDEFIGNLYYTKLVNGRWTPLVKLNDNINTKYWESHASMSRDRQTLYFTSNRKGGYGGLDIYKSKRQANGDWGPAINLGPKVNSPYNDDTPFITEDGLKLYFSSYGHYNMGGYDIFVTKKLPDGSWADPVNLGYPINTTDDDQFFFPVRDGQAAYYSRYSPQGRGKFDIYRYVIYSNDNPRMFPVAGLLDYMGEEVDSAEVNITVIGINSRDTVAMVSPDADGSFRFSVPAGEYNMIFNSDRFRQQMQKLTVSPATPHEGLTLPGQVALIPLPVPLTAKELDDLLTIRDTLIVVKDDNEVKIHFKADKDSRAVVNVFNDSVLIKTDTIEIDRKRQSYEFTPLPGHNKVVITVEDENGNRVQKSAEVIFQKQDNQAQTVSEDHSAQESASSESTVPLSIQAPLPVGSLNIVQNKLKSFAGGPLGILLDTLNPEKNNLQSTGDIIDYLNQQAGSLGYSADDVRALLKDAVTLENLSQFIRDMHRVSKGNLKNTLENFDPQKTGVRTPRELVDHLIAFSSQGGYPVNDILKSLGILASNETNDPYYLLKVIKSHSPGDLGSYLDYLKLEEENIRTASGLAVHLYEHAKGEAYTEEELLDLLTQLAVAKDALELKDRLSSLAEGDLKALIDTVELLPNNIYTAPDLVNFLYDNKYQLDYTKSDVDDLLRKELEREAMNIENLRLRMENQSQGNLKGFLSTMDVSKGNFSSEDEFIAFLKSHADSLGFTPDDVNDALLKMAYEGDLDDILRKLSQYATPALQDRLRSLDMEKENIHTLDDLIRDLFDNTQNYNYSRDDVINMLSDYNTMGDLQLFLRQLAELSKGNTRDFILAIDTDKQNIHTKQELVDYLLEQADLGNLDKEDIIRLILKASRIPANAAKPVLEYLGNDDITGLIGQMPANKLWAEDVFDYLLDQARTSKNISKEDILDLFGKYLENYDLHLFHEKLVENADGTLRAFLENNYPEKAGIDNVAGYIRYLLDEAGKNNYTKNDVYRLLAKVMGQDNLRQFIEQMKEFAGPDLRKALDELDPGKLNITNIDELIRYLISQGQKYGYTPSDIWDILLKMALKESPIPEIGKVDLSDEFARSEFKRGIRLTAGILILEGLAIFILILLAKRRKKKNEAEGQSRN